jgi:hypothetical protein
VTRAAKSANNIEDNHGMTDTTPRRQRSAVTTGRRAFVDLGSGNTAWGRRYHDLETLYADDLGGASGLSGYQLGLISTCASLRCELESMEGRLSLGEDVDLDQYGRLAGHYRRICETLGIVRRSMVVENPIVAEFNRKEAIRLAAYANMPEPDYSVTDFEQATKEGPQP